MRINISSVLNIVPTIIHSLVWSHNGTELASDGRHSIGNNGTSLTMSNMVQSDAGKYEVKINSSNLDDEGGICDKNILPMLANLAFYAPVTFVLREFSVSTYYPQDVISDYALPAYQGSASKTLDIDDVFMINVPAVFDYDYSILYEFLYKDGLSIRGMPSFHRTISFGNVTTQSLRISYSNTEDVTGHYYYGADISYTVIDRDICPQYSDYIGGIYPPVFSQHWNIRSYSELR